MNNSIVSINVARARREQSVIASVRVERAEAVED
jgi:hypothetical protein